VGRVADATVGRWDDWIVAASKKTAARPGDARSPLMACWLSQTWWTGSTRSATATGM